MTGLKSSQSGEVGMEQNGVDKREKVGMTTANTMEDRRQNENIGHFQGGSIGGLVQCMQQWSHL